MTWLWPIAILTSCLFLQHSELIPLSEPSYNAVPSAWCAVPQANLFQVWLLLVLQDLVTNVVSSKKASLITWLSKAGSLLRAIFTPLVFGLLASLPLHYMQ